jgi:hypothetical protein
VNREGIAAIALLAYPPAVRAVRGDEMLATLLDASAGSGRRFAREVVDLVRVGLRARATETARAGTGRLVADGLCLAAVWVMTLDLSTLLAQRYRGMHDPLLAWPSIALLAGLLALALIGFDRLAGVGALAWTALRMPHLGPFAPEVLPVVCFAVMLLAPRRRPMDVRRLAWLLVPAGLVVAFGPGDNVLAVALVALAALLVVAFAVALLPTDPRIAIAGAVPLSNLAVAVWSSPPSFAVLLGLGAAPAVLAIAVARTRQLRRT